MDYKTSQVEDEMNARFASIQAGIDAISARIKKEYGIDLDELQESAEAQAAKEKQMQKKPDEFDINRIQGRMSDEDIRSAAAAINRVLRPAAAAPVAPAQFDIERIGPNMSADDTKSILSVLRADGFKG
jgi:hypothetical protein